MTQVELDIWGRTPMKDFSITYLHGGMSQMIEFRCNTYREALKYIAEFMLETVHDSFTLNVQPNFMEYLTNMRGHK